MTSAWPLACLFALSFAATPVAAAEKPRPAGRAGLEVSRLDPLRPALQKFIDDKHVAGVVTVMGRRAPDSRVLLTVGFADADKQTPMRPDTLFRIASMTKIVTAVAVMILAEEGKLSVDDPVEKHLPEFHGQKLVEKRVGNAVTLVDSPRPITLKDLLTHTSGMPCSPPPGFAELYRDKNRSLAEGVVGFSQQPLETAPGTKWKYCSTAYDTIGRVVEVVASKPFEVFLEQRVFRPLGMKDTTFRPTSQQRARLATLYAKAGDGAEAHIEPAENQGVPGPPTGTRIVYPSPSGGLYTTALDYAQLLQMLLDGGGTVGRHGRPGRPALRLLRPETVAKLASVHFTYSEKVGFSPGLGMGLGVQVVMTPTGVTESLAVGSFGHGGAYGTQAWVDPKNDVYYLLMIQRQGFGNGDQADLRRVFQKIAAGALQNDEPGPAKKATSSGVEVRPSKALR